jgi:hypothetical protein
MVATSVLRTESVSVIDYRCEAARFRLRTDPNFTFRFL